MQRPAVTALGSCRLVDPASCGTTTGDVDNPLLTGIGSVDPKYLITPDVTSPSISDTPSKDVWYTGTLCC